MDDTISRQAAIDAIRASTKKYTGFMEMEMYTDDDAVDAIINLPSAQPEQKAEELLPDGTLHFCTDTDLSKVTRVWVSQNGTHYGDLYYADGETERWIPCSERLPEEDHWLGGSGKQFSDNVLISIVNRDDEDAWVQVSQTIDGTWALELPRYCNVIAWMPLPEPYKEGES